MPWSSGRRTPPPFYDASHQPWPTRRGGFSSRDAIEGAHTCPTANPSGGASSRALLLAVPRSGDGAVPNSFGWQKLLIGSPCRSLWWTSHADGSWEVSLPAEEVLPEPILTRGSSPPPSSSVHLSVVPTNGACTRPAANPSRGASSRALFLALPRSGDSAVPKHVWLAEAPHRLRLPLLHLWWTRKCAAIGSVCVKGA